MNTFCTDIDLLHWEPNLLKDATFASQTLISGSGNVAGTSFTIASGSFTDAKVKVDQLIKLGAPFDGTYPILAVDGATQLTLSVMYDGLFPPDNGPREAGPIGTASAVTYSVHTFFPQILIVSELLVQSAGLKEDQSGAILNPTALKRPCTLGALQMIYSALAAAAAEPADFSVRADLYERLYRRALRSAAIEIDLDGDGVPESRRALNVMELRRA
jgi:hypothetical protein